MKKINNFIKSRTFITTLGLTFIALIIAGITYAWFTWSSTDNTNITMQIGEYTTVTFSGGNDINVNNLAPVYNYIDGESTTFTLTNNNTDVTKEFKYNVYLDVTSISNELKTTQFKYVLLDGSSNIIDQGNFSSASDNSTLTITEDQTLPNGNSSYTFIVYIDGNEQNNPNMMNKSLSGSLRVTVARGESGILPPNPITDYEYEIGTSDLDGYVILKKYIGTSSTVIIPNTYNIDGVNYNTILYLEYGTDGGNYYITTFSKNNTIVDVTLPSNYITYYQESYNGNFALSTESMRGLFNGCSNLLFVRNLPNTVTDMYKTFYKCTSLVIAPEIPTSVTDIRATFDGCTSLEEVPAIPNSVTNMYGTFRGCTSLVNIPEIPNSVTSLGQTFMNCSSLVNVPKIPSSVTDISQTFQGCTNLTGTIRIDASAASYYSGHTFYGTSLPITVEVPEGSTTYTKLNTNLPANVTITTFTPE